MTDHSTSGDAPPPLRSTARDGGAPLAAASGRGAVPRPPAPRDLGMATAEYAITTLAACGFAGLLLVLLRGSEVRGLLLGLVRHALSVD